MVLVKLKNVKGIKRFKSLKNLQKYYKKNDLDDYFMLDGYLYYVEEYDLDGKLITYTSLEEDANISLYTKDRYTSKSDLHAEKVFGILSLRNDITHYYYKREIGNNLMSMFNVVF